MQARDQHHHSDPSDKSSSQSRRRFVRRCAAGAVATATATAAVAASSATAGAHPMLGTDAFVGEITIFAGTYAPRGWAFCEGQLLAIADNQTLFAILGTQYGGDGRTTFGLPDLKKQSKMLGVKYIIALTGIFPSRS